MGRQTVEIDEIRKINNRKLGREFMPMPE